MSLLMTRARKAPQQASLLTALQDQTHPLRAALDSVHVNCFIADMNLTLVWANRLPSRRSASSPRRSTPRSG